MSKYNNIKNALSLFVLLSLLVSCNSNTNNSQYIFSNDKSEISSNKKFSKTDDISKYFPKVSSGYEIHYTVIKSIKNCPDGSTGNISCADQSHTGFPSDDAYLKVIKNDDSNIKALIKFKDTEIQINEKPSNFWKSICLNFLNLQTKYVIGTSLKYEDIKWTVSENDEIIQIKSHELDKESETYSIREIKAKINGFEKEIIFLVSKEHGIIISTFENDRPIPGAMIETKKILIGKYVKKSNTPMPTPSSIIPPHPVPVPPPIKK